ncbi:MAG: hypothetical protein KatS3mg068_0900 [Candidatus Sericytochromatia bacterium]|nr:MAG: hypothetical protein KatS3mg068_0900 [Candidatus Sericytochromatia bacterium]
MTSFYEPTLNEIFYPARGEWKFTNDFESDLQLMKFNTNPYAVFEKMLGFDKLPDYVQKKLKEGHSIYSRSEIQGWQRIEFQNQRLIDMFKSDVIYVLPIDEEILFYKALENWFDGLAYGGEEFSSESDMFNMSEELSNYKSYGLTESLLSLFEK